MGRQQQHRLHVFLIIYLKMACILSGGPSGVRSMYSLRNKRANICQCILDFNSTQQQSVNHDVEFLFTITYNETRNEVGNTITFC